MRKDCELLVCVVIVAIEYYLHIIMLDQFNEPFTPTHYTLLKRAKATTAQKLFIIIFMALTEAYYIGRCFISLVPWADQEEAYEIRDVTRFILPIINILSIPLIYVACLAYYSEEVAFSEMVPDNMVLRRGVCSWERKSRRWIYEETIFSF